MKSESLITLIFRISNSNFQNFFIQLLWNYLMKIENEIQSFKFPIEFGSFINVN